MDSETIEDFLDFKCPYCGALNSFPAYDAGHVRECLNCVEAFLVPLADGEPARPLPLPLETERLKLRRFEPGDWKDLLEFQFTDEDEATGWLLTATKTRLSDAGQPLFIAVTARDSRKVVGTLGLKFAGPELDQAELLLIFASPGPFSGFEVEALGGMFEFGFRGLRLHRIFAECLNDHAETRRFFQGSGMRQEAELVKNKHLNGSWQTTLWFAMLEEEHFAKAGERKTS